MVLVHGYGDTGHGPWWETLAGYFHEAGYAADRVHTLSFGAIPGLTLGSPKWYARQIERSVVRVATAHDSRVDVVAHSMGGLGARWYVERAGGAGYVHDLVTLGTPHQGSRLAYTQPTPGGAAMRPESRFLERLNARRLPRAVDYTAVWSADDDVISPRESATLPFDAPNVRNLRVEGPGHMGLVSDRTVFETYVERLGDGG